MIASAAALVPSDAVTLTETVVSSPRAPAVTLADAAPFPCEIFLPFASQRTSLSAISKSELCTVSVSVSPGPGAAGKNRIESALPGFVRLAARGRGALQRAARCKERPRPRKDSVLSGIFLSYDGCRTQPFCYYGVSDKAGPEWQAVHNRGQFSDSRAEERKRTLMRQQAHVLVREIHTKAKHRKDADNRIHEESDKIQSKEPLRKIYEKGGYNRHDAYRNADARRIHCCGAAAGASER